MVIKAMFKFKKVTIRAIGYTRYIALPKLWLENLGLSVGDEVEVKLLKNGNIEIAPIRGAHQEPMQANTPHEVLA